MAEEIGAKNLVLSGSPGVGKTTLLRELLLPYRSRAGGFLTEELLEGRQRMGFLLKTLDGRQGVLASKALASPQRLNKYGVDMRVLEDLGVESLRRAARESDLVVIDEIGSMEILSGDFRAAVLECFAGEKPVLATIRHSAQPFTDAVKKMEDTALVVLSRPTYPEVREQVRSWLRSKLAEEE